MWKRLAICCCSIFLINICLTSAQEALIDSNYFINPVKHAVRLTGSFGELRSNHYHAGIDYRSSHSGKKDSIFAVADARVSRIKVQSGSYGQSLYLDHSNGYTSVYAHLDEYAPKIEYYLKKKQYEIEQSHIDFYLDSTKVLVKKGEFIGLMGNTGRSTGAHLHFELRETASEIPTNPFYFNLKPGDNKNPILKAVFLHELDSIGNFKDRNWLGIKKVKKSYKSTRDTLVSNTKTVGLAVSTFDQMDGLSNLNGTHKIKLFVEDSLFFDLTLDKISFEETRYINAAIDYAYKKKVGNSAIRVYRLPGNGLEMYKRNATNGVITLKSKPTKVKLVLEDFEGNNTNFSCFIKYKEKPKSNNTAALTSYNEPHEIVTTENEIKIPAYSFDHDLDFSIKCGINSCAIGNEEIPLYKYIKYTQIHKNLSSQHFIGKKNNAGTITSYGGKINGDSISCYIKDCGEYALFQDLDPPSLKRINMSKKSNQWTFKLTDNINTRGTVPDMFIRCEVDGHWIRHFYDEKNDLLIVKDIALISDRAKVLRILIQDAHTNKAHYTFNI